MAMDKDYPVHDRAEMGRGIPHGAGAGRFDHGISTSDRLGKVEARQPELPMLLGELAEALKIGDAIVARTEARLQSILRGSQPDAETSAPSYSARTQAGDLLAEHIRHLRNQYDALTRLLDRVEL